MTASNSQGITHWHKTARLARKYARQGPRYTSYPTAPQFSDQFQISEYLDALPKPNAATTALALYVHLPFCQDICYYCACNKQVTRKQGVTRQYLDHLQQEIALHSALIGQQRPITQMHWGGGTPTYLDDAELTELMHILASHFHLLDDEDHEYSIELDPRTVNHQTIALLKGLGFNRLSLGIQDFDPLVQKAINRLQPYHQVCELIDCIRQHGFRSISFDLIHGLPHQDLITTEETLSKVVSLRPERISCYAYAHLPQRFSSQRAIDRLTLPSAEDRLAQQLLTASYLTDAGYRHIGMDHYVLPDDDLAQAQESGTLQRNFQGYSIKFADDMLGLGVSAISQMGDYYLQNTRELNDYYESCAKKQLPVRRGVKITDEDRLRRHVIMALICQLQLSIVDCETRFGIDFNRHFSTELQALKPLIDDALITLSKEKIQVTETGRAFLRNICMPFDAYLDTSPPSNTTNTKTSNIYSITL